MSGSLLFMLEKTNYVWWILASATAAVVAVFLCIIRKINKNWKERFSIEQAKLKNEQERAESEIKGERERVKWEIKEAQERAEEEIKRKRERAMAEIKEEQQRAASEIKEARERTAKEIAFEREQAREAIKKEREHINAEKDRLMKSSEKELMVESIIALSGYGSRLDRIEGQLGDLFGGMCKAENLSKISLPAISSAIGELMDKLGSIEETVDQNSSLDLSDQLNGIADKLNSIKEAVDPYGFGLSSKLEDIEGAISSLESSISSIDFQIKCNS